MIFRASTVFYWYVTNILNIHLWFSAMSNCEHTLPYWGKLWLGQLLSLILEKGCWVVTGRMSWKVLLDSLHLDPQTSLTIELKERRFGPDILLQVLAPGSLFQNCRYPTSLQVIFFLYFYLPGNVQLESKDNLKFTYHFPCMLKHLSKAICYRSIVV